MDMPNREPQYALVAQVDLVVVRWGDRVSVYYGRCLHRGALLCADLVSRICIVWPQRREALIGLVYVLGAALALLAAQFNPHGKDDLQ